MEQFERKRIIYFILAVLVLNFICLGIPWYFGSNDVEFKTIERETKFSDLEASENFSKYNPDRDYFLVEKAVYSIQKGWFPLYYKKTVMKQMKEEHYSKSKD